MTDTPTTTDPLNFDAAFAHYCSRTGEPLWNIIDRATGELVAEEVPDPFAAAACHVWEVHGSFECDALAILTKGRAPDGKHHFRCWANELTPESGIDFTVQDAAPTKH